MADNKDIKRSKIPTGGDNTTTHGDYSSIGGGAEHSSAPSPQAPITIAQICVNNIYISGRGHYGNGDFIACFCDALLGIAKCKDFHANTLRVLLFMLGSMTKKPYLGLSFIDIKEGLGMADTSLRRAIEILVNSHILCSTSEGHANIYRLSEAIINPRVAIHGNTKKLNKKGMPKLLRPNDGGYLIESDAPMLPAADFASFWANPDTGEIA